MTLAGGPSVEERLRDLYPSNLRSKGHFDPKTGKMHTTYVPLTADDWGRHLKGIEGFGGVPILDDATCFWAAIDIDNHGQDEDTPIAPIDEKLRLANIPLIPCRSKSGGVHCYLFLNKSLSAAKIRIQMGKWAAYLGYPKAEIFPKQASLRLSAGKMALGNWINLPYLGGDLTERYAYWKGEKLKVNEFVELAERLKAAAFDLDSIRAAEHTQAPPCIHKVILHGVSQGNRNEAMYNTVIYLKRAFPDDYVERALTLNAEIFSKPLPGPEAKRTIASAGREECHYRCGEEPIRSLCDREECVKREFGIGKGKAEEVELGQFMPNFSNLVKYMTEPPRWEMHIDGQLITNISTEALFDWRIMRHTIAEKLTRVVPMIKAQEWERILQPLMTDCRIVEAPDDASVNGVIRARMREFASKVDLYNMGRDTADRLALLRGLPCVQVNEGERCVVFRSQDFIQYLKRTKSEELKGANLWFAVKAIGVRTCKMRVKDHTINVWLLPVEEVLAEISDVQPTKFEADL